MWRQSKYFYKISKKNITSIIRRMLFSYFGVPVLMACIKFNYVLLMVKGYLFNFISSLEK